MENILVFKTQTRDYLYAFLYETFGTTILVSSYSFAKEEVFIVLLAYWAAIVICFKVSGAHFNPCISAVVPFTILKRKDRFYQALMVIMYPLFQIIGGFAGCGIAVLFNIDRYIYYFQINDSAAPVAGFFMEAIMTFVFILTVLVCRGRSTRLSDDIAINSFVIATAYFAGIGVARIITGGALNPALALSTIISCLIYHGKTASLPNLWVYICGPYVGAIVAGLVYYWGVRIAYKKFKK